MTVLEDPSRVDDEALRADRRRRLFAAMADAGLDALVLGRPAEVAFASGARQLWTAGSRPFGPACVAVRSTGRVHLLSVWDEDVPPEVGHEDLYGLSWNPANIAASLAAVPGLREARRVGTTSSSPGFPRLLAAAAPGAEVVDGGPALWAARGPKSAAEVERIAAAIGVARIGLAAMEAALRPGATERDLLAAHLAAIAEAGAPTPPTEGVACATPATGPVALRRIAEAVPIEAGQLVALDPSGFFRGYEGGLGRTRAAGGAPSLHQAELAARCREAVGAVVAACWPGATGSDLVAAWERSGAPPPPEPLAVGVGLGLEPPVVGAGLEAAPPGVAVARAARCEAAGAGNTDHGGRNEVTQPPVFSGAAAVLAAGTILAVTGWMAEDGAGGVLHRDLVLVTDGEPRLLTEDA